MTGLRPGIWLKARKVLTSTTRELCSLPVIESAMRSVLATALAVLLALPGAAAAAAASTPGLEAPGPEAAMAVPVWNSSNGKLEAVLYIDTSTLGETAGTPSLGTRWRSHSGAFSSSLSARLEPRYGLLCGNPDGIVDRLDGCLVTQLGRPAPAAHGQLLGEASARLGRSEWTAFGATRRSGTDSLLPGTALALDMPELAPLAGLPGLDIERNDLGVVGELKLGEQGWIRVGGGVARARLLPADGSTLAGSVAPRWNSRTLSVGGGFGPVGGEVVGRVVRVPGESQSYGTLGLGLTWRTPWAGRLTVGAQNLISTGDNPVVPGKRPDARDEGRVPYVRYQQDL